MWYEIYHKMVIKNINPTPEIQLTQLASTKYQAIFIRGDYYDTQILTIPPENSDERDLGKCCYDDFHQLHNRTGPALTHEYPNGYYRFEWCFHGYSYYEEGEDDVNGRYTKVIGEMAVKEEAKYDADYDAEYGIWDGVMTEN